MRNSPVEVADSYFPLSFLSFPAAFSFFFCWGQLDISGNFALTLIVEKFYDLYGKIPALSLLERSP